MRFTGRWENLYEMRNIEERCFCLSRYWLPGNTGMLKRNGRHALLNYFRILIAPFVSTPVSILLSAVYDMCPDDAAQINTTTEVMANFARRIIHALSPGAYWVEYFPWMQHLPRSIAKWKRDAQDSYECDSRTFEGYLSDVDKRLVCLTTGLRSGILIGAIF